MSDPYVSVLLTTTKGQKMNDYELDEMLVSTPCVECGDTLEAWELNEANLCFICEVLG